MFIDSWQSYFLLHSRYLLLKYSCGMAGWYRLCLPPRRLELWIVRSNPARVYVGWYLVKSIFEQRLLQCLTGLFLASHVLEAGPGDVGDFARGQFGGGQHQAISVLVSGLTLFEAWLCRLHFCNLFHCKVWPTRKQR
jgi:hypothetical protein